MTTIITRLYDDARHADSVVETLRADGFPENTMDIVVQAARTSAFDQIRAAGVPLNAARSYAQQLTADRALLVVRAPFVPFGAARRAIEVANTFPALNAGVENENLNVPDQPDRQRFSSVLKSHRLFLTAPYEVRSKTAPQGFSRSFRIPLLLDKPKRRVRPAVIRTNSASRWFFPLPLLSERSRANRT